MPEAWTTERLAALVGATCEGDPQRRIAGVAELSTAGPQQLAFCGGGPWRDALAATEAGAVFVDDLPVPKGTVGLRHPHPRWAFAVAAAALHPVAWPSPGVHARAWVASNAHVEGATIDALAVVEAGARIEPGAWVQPHAYVGRDAVVGAGSRVMPGAVVMDGCTLGERVCLHPGAVVGADGFGHVPGPGGVVHMPQLGRTVIEDDVEVGANACVDRAALGETRVGRGSRLDNLVQIAHGVQVGAESLLAAFVGVAGGARLGRGVMMGGRAAVVDGVTVGDGARFAASASAIRDVPAGAQVGGTPARPFRNWLREMAALRRLPGLLRRLERRAPHGDESE